MPDDERVVWIVDDEVERACLDKLTDILTTPCGRRTNNGPAEVSDHLFVGSALDAVDRRLLSRLRITHVLNCTSAETIHDYADVGYRPEPTKTAVETNHFRQQPLPVVGKATSEYDADRHWHKPSWNEPETRTCRAGGDVENGRSYSGSRSEPTTACNATTTFNYYSQQYRPGSSFSSSNVGDFRLPKRYVRSQSSSCSISSASPTSYDTGNGTRSYSSSSSSGSSAFRHRPMTSSSSASSSYADFRSSCRYQLPVSSGSRSSSSFCYSGSSNGSSTTSGWPTSNGHSRGGSDCDDVTRDVIVYRGADGSPYDPSRSPVRAYLEMGADDTPGYPLLKRHYPAARQFIESAREAGGRALIHCELGINRSAALAVAYVVDTEAVPLTQAVRRLRLERPNVLRNEGFRRQLIHFAAERRLVDGCVVKV